MEALLLGLDGGATELKAHQVVPLFGGLFELGPNAQSRQWSLHPHCANFRPEPVAVQRACERPTAADLSIAERRAGDAWVELTIDAVAALARESGARRIQVGACFPGLKTPDRRGIALSRNGPRIPNFAARIEDGLRAAGMTLVTPIHALQSDGHCCGVGEEHGVSGSFRGVRAAYYLGGGTGLPEALKLAGMVVPLDALRGELSKAWELELAPGRNFEDEIAPAALNRRWRAIAPGLGAGGHVEEAAARGEPRAADLLERAGACIAALCFERLARFASGAPWGGESVVLERIVIGQRLGEIWESEGGAVLRAAALEHLAAMVVGSGEKRLDDVWLRDEAIVPERIVASRLRAAPALGAAVLAREPFGA